MKTFIYGLVDPVTHVVGYAGKTAVGLRRPETHRRASNLRVASNKNVWISGLLASGLDYEIVVLEVIDGDPKAPATNPYWQNVGRNPTAINEAERWWIALLGRVDYGTGTLLNKTDGGEGNAGNVASVATRKKQSISQTGRKHTAETLEQLRVINTGRKHTPETMVKFAGRTHSVKTRSKIGEAKRGVPMSPQACENMAKAQTGRKHSSETITRMQNTARVRNPHPMQVRHGSTTAYQLWGCRCLLCKEAISTRLSRAPKRSSERRVLHPVQVKHGTQRAYAVYGCRCRLCRDLNATQSRKQREQQRTRPNNTREYAVYGHPVQVNHGTSVAYGYWGCRCAVCKAARVIANARRVQRA